MLSQTISIKEKLKPFEPQSLFPSHSERATLTSSSLNSLSSQILDDRKILGKEIPSKVGLRRAYIQLLMYHLIILMQCLPNSGEIKCNPFYKKKTKKLYNFSN